MSINGIFPSRAKFVEMSIEKEEKPRLKYFYKSRFGAKGPARPTSDEPSRRETDDFIREILGIGKESSKAGEPGRSAPDETS